MKKFLMKVLLFPFWWPTRIPVLAAMVGAMSLGVIVALVSLAQVNNLVLMIPLTLYALYLLEVGITFSETTSSESDSKN